MATLPNAAAEQRLAAFTELPLVIPMIGWLLVLVGAVFAFGLDRLVCRGYSSNA